MSCLLNTILFLTVSGDEIVLKKMEMKKYLIREMKYLDG